VTVQRFDSERLRKDGSRVRVTLTMSPVLGPDGSVVGVSAIAHDRTAEKSRLTEAMRQAEKEALRPLASSTRCSPPPPSDSPLSIPTSASCE